ncbi:MAG: hypothetical protein GX887_02790 [Firmicutes bacterium]|nr:hypothetical protein [Bacillota bacterium]
MNIINNGVTAVVFEGGYPASDIEKMLVRVRDAVLLDNLQKMVKVDALHEIILVTNYAHLIAEAGKMGLDKVKIHEVEGDHFHFGRELKKVISRYRLHRVFYIGGASFPLLEQDEIGGIASSLLCRRNAVLTNNPQSSDLVAFSPAEAIHNIEPPPDDNSLAISLRDQAGLEMELLPYTAGILFDLDTPTDYLILGGSPFAGERAREALEDLPLDFDLLERAKEVLRGYYRETVLIGRVGAPLIAHLNCNLQLRLRIFSEERGMKALGRESAGVVESILAHLIDEVGIDKFFSYLEKVAEVAFIDTRVLFAHFKLKLSAEERFLSDMGCWQEIENPWLKEFTRAAAESAIPIVLGGHSLVSGGIWVLAEEIMLEK